MPAPAVSHAEYLGKMQRWDIWADMAFLMAHSWKDDEIRESLERIEGYIMQREGRVR